MRNAEYGMGRGLFIRVEKRAGRGRGLRLMRGEDEKRGAGIQA
jgi:hypothetical protein